MVQKWPRQILRETQKLRKSLFITAARAGIEPCIRFLEACTAALSSETAKTPDAQLHAQELSSLTKIVAAWPKLAGEFRAAVLAMTASVSK